MVSLWAPFLSAQHYFASRRFVVASTEYISVLYGGIDSAVALPVVRWRLRVLPLVCASVRRCDALPMPSIGDLSFEWLLDASPLLALPASGWFASRVYGQCAFILFVQLFAAGRGAHTPGVSLSVGSRVFSSARVPALTAPPASFARPRVCLGRACHTCAHSRSRVECRACGRLASCVFVCCSAHSRPSCVVRASRATWLILPVVICLSQRLSHACLSISDLYCETANGSLNQLWFI